MANVNNTNFVSKIRNFYGDEQGACAHIRKGKNMNFDQLVGEQLKTMDKLLYLQSEIERCQDLKNQLDILQDATKLQSIQDEIENMKEELNKIQQVFEKQTQEVIQSYEDQKFETVS